MYRKLAIAFVAAALAACVSDQTYQAEVKKTATYEALSKQLQTEIKADQVQIQQLQDLCPDGKVE